MRATAFILALCFFTFGYDGSVMSGILAMPTFVAQFGSRGPNGTRILTATDTSVITAVPISGALLGLPLAAYFGDRIGRKKTLLVACVISTIGAVLQTAAVHMATFTVGRWLASELSRPALISQNKLWLRLTRARVCRRRGHLHLYRHGFHVHG